MKAEIDLTRHEITSLNLLYAFTVHLLYDHPEFSKAPETKQRLKIAVNVLEHILKKFD